MCVCVCVKVIYIYIHICVCVYVCVCMYVCVYVCIRMGVRLSGDRVVRAAKVISAIGWRKTAAMLPASSVPERPLKTAQSCGFVMGNITLKVIHIYIYMCV